MRHTNMEDSEIFSRFVQIVEEGLLSKAAAGDSRSGLYGVTSETGEQLIGDAHKGGGTTTKLDHKPQKDLAKVETIVEQHKKNEEVALKMPTGKMAALAVKLTALSNVLDENGFTVLADEIDSHISKFALNPFAASAGSLESKVAPEAEAMNFTEEDLAEVAPAMDFTKAPLAEDAAKMYEELEREKKIAPPTKHTSPVVPVVPGSMPSQMPQGQVKAMALVEKLITLANRMDDQGFSEIAVQLDNEAKRVTSHFLALAPAETGALKIAEYGYAEMAEDIQKMHPGAQVTHPGQEPKVEMGKPKVTTSPAKHHEKARQMLGLAPGADLHAALKARGIHPESAQNPGGYSTWGELFSQIEKAKGEIKTMLS